ncbi:MAG: NAD-dependent epimerase/dehydratase family protein [Planctomycetota bacterium]
MASELSASDSSLTVSPAVAVTGASGFLGRHLADRFRSLGWEVRALVRDPSRRPWREPGVRVFACDLPDRIDPAGLEGARWVVHCAYTTRFRDLESARRANELGTRNLLALAREKGAEKFVFISSQSAHEGARSYYGRSKLALEKLCAPDSDLVLRLGLIVGREGSGLFHRMVEAVRRSRAIPLFGGGRQPLQTVHVEDAARAIGNALDRGLSGLFTLAHPEPISMREFLSGIAGRLGKRPIFVPLPIAPALLALRAFERLGVPLPVSSENLLGLTCLRAADTREDLARLGVELRGADEALDEALGPPRP